MDETIAGQRHGLLFALVTIPAMMMFAMRSWRTGLVSMIPNAQPLLALLGYMGWFWETTDTDTLAVLMVAISIGVDDTIHFLMRLRFEAGKTEDISTMVRQTFHYSGRAIVITSFILVVGFAPFALSDYFSVRIFGTLLPACLVVALIADLFLLPALIQLGWIKMRAK